MHAEPQEQHKWLQKLLGDWTWTYESDCNLGPDQPPVKLTGSETVRSLGGLWVICDGKGEMPGGGVGTTIMTLGYDPQKKRFVGTFIGSMMTNQWVYDGELDAGGKALTLNADGPSFNDPAKTAKYQDTIEWKNDDYRTLSSQFLGDDGKWVNFMTSHYQRKK